MRFVYTAYSNHESGFSLLSVLFAITILFMFIPFIVYLIKASFFTSYYEELSVGQFFHFMQDEFIMAERYEVNKNAVSLIVNDETVTIDKYGSNVRRQVNGTGHEIFLRDIKAIIFNQISYGVRIQITTLNGGVYEKTIRYYD